MKKKILIRVIILLLTLFLLFVLLTETNMTKELAFSTAKNKLHKLYPEYGETVSEDIVPSITKHLVFPKYKLRSYSVVFLNENNDRVGMEVSAYLPFVVLETEFYPKVGPFV